ncbi:hypothetical protein RFI_19933 [Reticulomyxa filosa]|uniref:Uncharacterized protein n=1 Tax=Reticulomyxa filosa TaxID=46433 RepID=X6MWF0_RETFI|nr:hypothetical protein RFI_19933 [Reticulomyxa filosa]|eukprot:ETO17390.1 hypothetical protein RFI_19933 [Reticulomyxa filosa]
MEELEKVDLRDEHTVQFLSRTTKKKRIASVDILRCWKSDRYLMNQHNRDGYQDYTSIIGSSLPSVLVPVAKSKIILHPAHMHTSDSGDGVLATLSSSHLQAPTKAFGLIFLVKRNRTKQLRDKEEETKKGKTKARSKAKREETKMQSSTHAASASNDRHAIKKQKTKSLNIADQDGSSDELDHMTEEEEEEEEKEERQINEQTHLPDKHLGNSKVYISIFLLQRIRFLEKHPSKISEKDVRIESKENEQINK